MYNVCQKGVSNICAKMGRPTLDNPKSNDLKVRIDDVTYERLLVYCKSHNLTKAEAVRQGICLILESEKK